MDSAPRAGRTTEVTINVLNGTHTRAAHDDLVTEEPLELRLAYGQRTATIAVTMRTPGNDFELAAGFLLSEGIVTSREHIAEIAYCVDPAIDREQRYNIVTVTLAGNEAPPLERLERHFTINSSCGVCGRAALESLRERGVTPVRDDLRIDATLLYDLPERMREAQRVFASTGGVHAAALFDAHGTALVVREDVGRHNALDKIVGWGILKERLPFTASILLVSGRASYDILQKAVVARIPMICAVSAPSSLAVDLAREFNITLVGFLRERRANIYSSPHRIL